MKCVLQQNLGFGVSRKGAGGSSSGAGNGTNGDPGDHGGCGGGGSDVVFWLLLKPGLIQPRLTWHSPMLACEFVVLLLRPLEYSVAFPGLSIGF